MLFTNFYCLNSFVFKNNNHIIIFHPGVWQFTLYNYYWSECYSELDSALRKIL